MKKRRSGKIANSIISFVLGKGDKNPQARYYNAKLFSAALFSSISCIFNFLENFHIALNIFSVFSSVVLILLYYLSRFKNYHNTWLSVSTILLLLSVFWFMNGGLTGSIPYIYLLSLIIFVIISNNEQQDTIFYMYLINLILLYGIEHFWGDQLINPYKSKQSHYLDLIFVFMLVLFSLFFLARFIKRSYDHEKAVVTKQKKLIEDTNKELISSLRYASDLQKKIISNGSKLNLLFEDYFVLFKPKDIVSGDFLWVKEKGHYSIVVAADCTGHGVPAAFLSILGISLLDEIITHEKDGLNAALVLNKVRAKFIPYLRKDNNIDGQSLDGIDLAICIINYQDYTFQFSGANRPLFMIRSSYLPEIKNHSEVEKNEKHNLFTFKATKNTIGFNYREDPFQNHIIEFFPGDTFYIFSDGYADQFNEENKKKFNVKRFKNELMQIQHLPMGEQGVYLNKLHKKWRGNNIQTDDILVIGLKM